MKRRAGVARSEWRTTPPDVPGWQGPLRELWVRLHAGDGTDNHVKIKVVCRRKENKALRHERSGGNTGREPATRMGHGRPRVRGTPMQRSFSLISIALS